MKTPRNATKVTSDATSGKTASGNGGDAPNPPQPNPDGPAPVVQPASRPVIELPTRGRINMSLFIESALIAGREYRHYSNVNHVIRSELLERLLTALDLDVRIFGTLTLAYPKHNMVIAATSNTPTLAWDLLPRTLVSRLCWKGGDPNRRIFSRQNLDEWGKHPHNRAEFMGFAKDIFDQTAANGWPDPPTQMASFQSWSKYVGVPAMVFGEADFLADYADVR